MFLLAPSPDFLSFLKNRHPASLKLMLSVCLMRAKKEQELIAMLWPVCPQCSQAAPTGHFSVCLLTTAAFCSVHSLLLTFGASS